MHWHDPDHPRNLRLKIKRLENELESVASRLRDAVDLLESSIPYLPPGYVGHEEIDDYIKNLKGDLKQWER